MKRTNFRSFRNYIDLAYVLTQKEIKVRYKNNMLGYLWSIANPLAFAFVFFLAFKIIIRIEMENYLLFLLTGLFPWQWFSNSLNFSNSVFLSNASIIKKVNFPRYLLPLATVLQDTFHFIVSIPVIVLVLLLHHESPSLLWFVHVPVMLCIQTLMVYGITLIIASINLFFRDMERLINIFLMLLFYSTPILYPPHMIPEGLKHYMNLNPIAPLITSWRDIFLTGAAEPAMMLLSAVYAIVFMGVGLWVYNKLSRRFAEVL